MSATIRVMRPLCSTAPLQDWTKRVTASPPGPPNSEGRSG